LKCPNWKLWAYTDGSCIGKAEKFIGTGVYCPQTKAECNVDSGGVGMINTINRAELTGIGAALTNKYTQIAMDSACSLSQIRKQLLFPEMQQDHVHSNLLEPSVSMIYASPEPICF
jgi:ribonuclease HI